MIRLLRTGLVAAALAVILAAPVDAQSNPSTDPNIARIWAEGMENSHVYMLGQTLMDSIGPRLTGSPASSRASDWAIKTYASWGIDAEREEYGTWRGWRRGITHVDLVAPRVRTLEAIMLAWSPGTDGPVEADAVVVPDFQSRADLDAFAADAAGKFVLVALAEPTCRPNDNWATYATEESFQRMQESRAEARAAFQERFARAGVSPGELTSILEEAGALGILTSRWSNGWGVQKIFRASTTRVPTIDLSCEDYGLVYRLAENGQGPVLRIEAESEDLGEVPTFNTIATIPGTELPDEYVVLSAHFDSWDAGSGATDNGTGTITMMEAARILKTVYPNPKRTIIVGHWEGEEQGLIGSRAYAADHPEVVEGMQALFNQDNGTGRVTNISMQGLSGAGAFFGKWISQIPSEISRHINLRLPGTPGGGGSDYASFVCAGAPSFGISSLSWEYGTYTWHTQRDTFDKIVLDDVVNNATLTAMLAYLASEDPDRVPRDQSVLPTNPRTGQQMTWPTCRDGQRSSHEYFNR